MAAFVVEHDSPLTAWGQIRRDLRRRVDEGEFVSGARIPTEAALMEQYGVSRVTIRRTIAAMVEDGYVESRRGSGTYVTGRALTGRYDLDLYKPWREQLIAQGHDARSRMDYPTAVPVPPELERSFREHASSRPLVFARELHLVDDIPLAITESWSPVDAAKAAALYSDQEVAAECFAEIGFATTVQAELLRSYLDIPLIVVHARSRLAATGELVELSRTSWLGSRVRLSYGRTLLLSDIDSMQLLLGRTGADRFGADTDDFP
ncbi:GntR family transcriptional regulator [Rhodococcus sp. NPDC079359]|uniref:GntR family transcriptional regulator n=1 Tax=Rhodococcus sp. NPDC079359 TaxID=3154961 RepID=UPI00344F63D9